VKPKKPDTLKRLIAARAVLLLDSPMWGVPALRLQPLEDPSCDTAWVDGVRIGYNPTFVDQCTPAELKFLWAHEVWHCAMGHPWRRGGRDPEEWNEAADRAINPVLRDAGFTLPKGVLEELTPEHNGKSAEWIHARMPKPPKTPEGGSGGGEGGGEDDSQQQSPTGQQGPEQDQKGKPAPSKPSWKDFGEVRDAPKPAEGQEGPSEEDWRQIVQQAAAIQRARQAGKFPAGMERAAEEAAKSRIDWRPALHRFAQEVTRADYSWARPNPRYALHGLYMPGMRSEEVGAIAVTIDTSGSVDEVMLGQFEKEIQAVVEEVRPRRVFVLSADAKVHRVEEFTRDDIVKLHPSGGGGTDFRPAFQELEKLDEPVVCMIYLTDLYGTFPGEDPGIPTLWVTPRDDDPKVPFGEVLSILN